MKKQIIAGFMLLLLLSTVSALTNTILLPQDNEWYKTPIKINGTVSAAANVTYKVDDGTWMVACTNCVAFENTTTVSRGIRDITVNSTPVGGGTSDVDTITVNIYSTNIYGFEMLVWIVRDAAGIMLTLVTIIIYVGIFLIVGVIIKWMAGILPKRK